MTYIVMQRKDAKYGEPLEPYGEFIIHRLNKLTPKCIFTEFGNWGHTERHRVEDFYFKTFDDKESAEQFVKEAEKTTGVEEIREEYEYAKDVMREAGDTYRAALKQAGKIAWGEDL